MSQEHKQDPSDKMIFGLQRRTKLHAVIPNGWKASPFRVKYD